MLNCSVFCTEVYVGNNSKAIVSHVVDLDLRQKTLWNEDCVPGPVEAIGKRDYTDCRCRIEQGAAALPPIDFDRWSRSYACVILPVGLQERSISDSLEACPCKHIYLFVEPELLERVPAIVLEVVPPQKEFEPWLA